MLKTVKHFGSITQQKLTTLSQILIPGRNKAKSNLRQPERCRVICNVWQQTQRDFQRETVDLKALYYEDVLNKPRIDVFFKRHFTITDY